MAKRQLTEIQLLHGCRKNDRLAQEQLYRKYFSNMMAMLVKHTKDQDTAMEILNKGMLRVFQKIELFESKGSLEGWIRRIVYREMCNHFNSTSNYVKYLILENHDAPIQHTADEHEQLDEIMQYVNSLPYATARVFKLFAIEGYKHKEIADQLAISEGTSKWHLAEARKLLKQKLMQSENFSNYGA